MNGIAHQNPTQTIETVRPDGYVAFLNSSASSIHPYSVAIEKRGRQ